MFSSKLLLVRVFDAKYACSTILMDWRMMKRPVSNNFYPRNKTKRENFQLSQKETKKNGRKGILRGTGVTLYILPQSIVGNLFYQK